MKISSGILVYKFLDDTPFFLLGHPGGPFYKNKDAGCWTIPKGLINDGEDLFNAALREFKEETNLILSSDHFIELPIVHYKNGKVLYAFAVEANLNLDDFKSNLFEARWLKGSNDLRLFPEIDRIDYFDHHHAQEKIHPVQLPFIQFILNKY